MGSIHRRAPGRSWLSKRVPDAVIVVGAYLLDHYRDRAGHTVHISNGVTPSSGRDDGILGRLGLRPGEYALFVGRLIPEKVSTFSSVRSLK